MAARGGEYWSTSADADSDERAGQWEQMLSTTHLPWTVQASHDEGGPFEAT